MTNNNLKYIDETIFYDSDLFPLLGLKPGATITEDDFCLSKITIETFRNKNIEFKIDHEKFGDTLNSILVENRYLDHKIKIRAILVFFILKNIADINTAFPILLTADALQVYQDIQEGQDIDILGKESKYFNNYFFNELKKSQSLMLDVIETIYQFVKKYSLQYDRLYKLISNVIEANEESTTPVLTEQLNFMDIKDVEEEYKQQIQKLFPIILPFKIKHDDYVKSYNPEVIIPFNMNSHKILDFVWNVLDATSQPNVSFRVAYFDRGGDKKENIFYFIEQSFTEIMKAEADLFENRNGYYWFKYHKNVTEELKHKYYCVGLLLANVIYNNYKIPYHFSRYFYKKLLHRNISPAEIELFDPDYFNYIDELINDENIADFDIDFTYEDFLYHYTIDLTNFEDITGKDNIHLKKITNENKSEFIHKLTEWIFDKSIQEEFEAFEKGFLKMKLNPMLYSSFRLDELDLIVSGKNDAEKIYEIEDNDIKNLENVIKKNRKFKWDDLKKNAVYIHYDKNSKTVQWFWEYFDKLNNNKKLILLKPILTICRPEIESLINLKITITLANTKYPTFGVDGTLLLPEYEFYEDLAEDCDLSFF